MTNAWARAGAVVPLLALTLGLAVCCSFWLAPAPLGSPEIDYWGHYVRVGPGLGFVVNHDSYGYIAVAQEPHRLLLPREVRQSRPLYALLGAAVGYPLTAGLRLAGRVGLAPQLWPEVSNFWGFYGGYVLLNALALLGSLRLLRYLWRLLAAGRGASWQFYALAWVLVANPVTKAFFWTAHQQMFAFLVPLFCVALAAWLRQRPALGWGALSGGALALGLLPLVYGSFVLVWPALAYGLLGPGFVARATAPAAPWWRAALAKAAASAALFAVPTLLWIALLRAHGTTYYNHEAERYHQLVWLLEAQHLPLTDYFKLVFAKIGEYFGSFYLMKWWLLGVASLYGATWWRQRFRHSGPLLPPTVSPALAWVSGCFGLFFALLGYYPERLTYALLPLVLCLLAALLPHWPPRYAQPVAFTVAAAWHLYVVLSYGPFS